MKASSDRSKTAVVDPAPAVDVALKPDPPRGTIAEWTITILLLLFGTTTLVQAFVIPTGSMEDTLLIGDHLLVDKLAYAPSGKVSKYILPYEEPQARRYHRLPLSGGHQPDLRQARHWRSGRPHPHRQQTGLSERHQAERAVRFTRPLHRIPIATISQRAEPMLMDRRQLDMLENHVVNGEVVVPPNLISPWATTATIRSTAATGALCRARISSASRSSFTGPTTPHRRVLQDHR
jgi:hypothetical protein